MGKPAQITYTNGTTIVYTYDATGAKLKTATTVSSVTTTTDYAGGYVYTNNTLSFFGSPEGRVTMTGNNVLGNMDGSSSQGFNANQNVTITQQNIGSETYVKAVSNQNTSTPGVWPIGNQISVNAGENYTLRVKCYSTLSQPYLYVSTNLGNQVWPGAIVPLGSSNEAWVTSSFTVPAGATWVKVGILWTSPQTGAELWINQIELNKITPEYQYSIADHQGNTRVVFSSATPAPDAPLATFEGDTNDKSNQYLNVSNVVTFNNAAHSGTKVVRMNQSYATGPSKSVKVYAGDKIDMEVWSYYESTSGYGSSNQLASFMISAIATAFGGVSGGGGESGSIFNGVNSAITNFGLGSNPGDTQPSAFLNYIMFDVNYKVLDMGWQRVPAGSFTKQQVTIPQITAKESGYVFVYLSYEDASNNNVYFDDLKVTTTKTNIVQYNEYYPFGLQTANSWTRDNATGNNFLGNGGTEYNATSSLYDLDFRNYDPILGRLHGVDPVADKYSSLTPYNFAFNNPAGHNDPSGADPFTARSDYYYEEMSVQNRSYAKNYIHEVQTGVVGAGGYDDYGWQQNPMVGPHITPGSGNFWSDGMNQSMDLAFMSTGTYEKFYGVNLSSNEGRWSVAQAVGERVGMATFEKGNGVVQEGAWIAGVGGMNMRQFLGIIRQLGRFNIDVYNAKNSNNIFRLAGNPPLQGGYYTINQVLKTYGYQSREDYLFPEPSFLERLLSFGLPLDREDLLEKMGETITGQWDFIHKNVSSVDLDRLELYRTDLFNLRWNLMTKVERLTAEIEKLRQYNPGGGNNAQIRSLRNLMYDITDHLIPVNYDINEVSKAITNRQIH